MVHEAGLGRPHGFACTHTALHGTPQGTVLQMERHRPLCPALAHATSHGAQLPEQTRCPATSQTPTFLELGNRELGTKYACDSTGEGASRTSMNGG
eukprot:33940-Chlamydomonas_euryale.AAC.2